LSPGRRSASEERPHSLGALMAAKEIVICCGSGGVGKTTTAAAAAAMSACKQGGKVLVLTVDPAKRLANALGLEGIGNTERQIPPEAFAGAGVRPRGELWAAMLDTKQSWDNLIHRHAPDKATEQRILHNPLYQNISGRFVQSHDYIAMERLYELHSEGSFDLIVVDTPPTRNALDFLEAPARMADFFSSRLLRLLIVPYRSRFVNVASKPFYQVADRILGSQFLEDIAEFFILFQTMYDGFVQRARAVERLLHDRRTTFVVVSTLEAAPVREAEFFIDVLTEKKFHLGALVLNKVLPDYLLDEADAARAERLSKSAEEIAGKLAAEVPEVGEPEQAARVLREVGESFRNYGVVAQREAKQREELAAVPEVVATVPYFETDIYDLDGLLRLGDAIWS
jgi:anion-transporting  ArsA/GET3 family ATPase